LGITLTRGSGSASEGAILDVFAREGLSPHRWSSASGAVYGAHSHPYRKVLFCLRGSITFRLVDDGSEIELFAGDRLDIEPGTAHSAIVGADGVTCIEAAGTAEASDSTQRRAM
jgi:quercetin dioxygenase-like cupin family protein